VDKLNVADGVKLAVRVAESYETVPETGEPPCINVKEVESMVALLTASLKVAITIGITAVFVAFAAGLVDTTLGGVVS